MPHFAFRLALASWLLLIPAGSGVWAKPGAVPGAKVQASSVPRPVGPPKVDSVRVHTLYMEGEFDTAIAILETNLKETRPYRHEDSVFIFKHLGVMYAAQYDTREKGKYYMHRLLTVEPSAKIMDMYASDMIYMIFRNIQEEFEQNRMFMGMQRQSQIRADTPSAGAGTRAKKDTPRTDPRASDSRSSGGKKWIWGGFAVAAVAAGVGAYVLMNDHGVSGKDFEY